MKRFVFTKLNSTLLILGVLLLIIGYSLMRTGDTVLSPIILVVSYVVIFPLAVISGFGKKSQ